MYVYMAVQLHATLTANQASRSRRWATFNHSFGQDCTKLGTTTLTYVMQSENESLAPVPGTFKV